MLYEIPETSICLRCGEEVVNGLIPWAHHMFECKGNGENMNIESHHERMAMRKIREEEWERFKPTYEKMTYEERTQLLMFSMMGTVGKEILNRFEKFKQEMIDKYSK